VGCYIWYSEEGTGRGPSLPRPLPAVPNVTAHPSMASVPITLLLYNGPLLCDFNVPVKGLTAGLLQTTSLRKFWLKNQQNCDEFLKTEKIMSKTGHSIVLTFNYCCEKSWFCCTREALISRLVSHDKHAKCSGISS